LEPVAALSGLDGKTLAAPLRAMLLADASKFQRRMAGQSY